MMHHLRPPKAKFRIGTCVLRKYDAPAITDKMYVERAGDWYYRLRNEQQWIDEDTVAMYRGEFLARQGTME